MTTTPTPTAINHPKFIKHGWLMKLDMIWYDLEIAQNHY
jgi:hypothetical protein